MYELTFLFTIKATGEEKVQESTALLLGASSVRCRRRTPARRAESGRQRRAQAQIKQAAYASARKRRAWSETCG